jgi:hypothetical protein
MLAEERRIKRGDETIAAGSGTDSAGIAWRRYACTAHADPDGARDDDRQWNDPRQLHGEHSQHEARKHRERSDPRAAAPARAASVDGTRESQPRRADARVRSVERDAELPGDLWTAHSVGLGKHVNARASARACAARPPAARNAARSSTTRSSPTPSSARAAAPCAISPSRNRPHRDARRSAHRAGDRPRPRAPASPSLRTIVPAHAPRHRRRAIVRLAQGRLR